MTAGRAAGPRVLIVSGSVGAGHDGVARELAARLTAAGASVALRDYLDAVPRPIVWLLRDIYLATATRTPLVFEVLFRRFECRGLSWRAEQAVCRVARSAILAWADEVRADVVVATYPPASQTIGALRAEGRLSVPALTYLTDPAVHINWLHPGTDAHLAVTAATAKQGAARYGVSLEVAGPLVQARFSRRLPAQEVAQLRAELSDDDRPLALLATGSLALGDVVQTADDVAAAGFTAVVLCGRNQTLRRRLSGRPGVAPLGWRPDVDRLLQAVDVLVQNAGGLSFTESLVAGLPAVTYRPIPGHGRANAQVLDAAGLAPWARTPAELATHLHAQAARGRVEPEAFPDPTDAVLRHAGAIAPAGEAA